MKSYTLALLFLTIAASYWLLGSNMPAQTAQPKITAKQEVNSSEPSRVFANMAKSVFKNKAAKTSDIGENNNATVLSKGNKKLVRQEPQLSAIRHERDRAEAFNEEAIEGDAAETTRVEYLENWDKTTQIALTETDPELRGEAIQAVRLYRHKDAVGVLAEVSAVDPEPSNRAKAVQALWHAAADDPEAMADIKSQLEKSGNDPDPIVATLAAKAIVDLDKLAKQRSQLN